LPPFIVRQVPLGLQAPQHSLKLFDLQCRQAVNQAQFLDFLLKKLDLVGGCCGSDRPADPVADQFTDKNVIKYPRC
jgi:hypothetical protein